MVVPGLQKLSELDTMTARACIRIKIHERTRYHGVKRRQRFLCWGVEHSLTDTEAGTDLKTMRYLA